MEAFVHCGVVFLMPCFACFRANTKSRGSTALRETVDFSSQLNMIKGLYDHLPMKLGNRTNMNQWGFWVGSHEYPDGG